MSLSFGRPMVAIPGPSIVPDRVLAAMHRPMPNIYSGELPDLAYELIDELPAIARTEGRAFVSISNGHGAWQMAICNTLSRDDTVLVLESGRFATVWGEMAALSGVRIETVPGDTRCAVDPEAVTAHLVDDTERRIKAILMVHTDTSTSVRTTPPPFERRSTRPIIPRCSSSTASHRWGASASRWMRGGSTSRCPAHRRA